MGDIRFGGGLLVPPV